MILLLKSNQLILKKEEQQKNEQCDDLSFQLLDRDLAPLGLGTLLAVLVLQNGEFLLVLQQHGGKLGIELSVRAADCLLDHVIQGLLAYLGLRELPLLLLGVELPVELSLAQATEVVSEDPVGDFLVLGDMVEYDFFEGVHLVPDGFGVISCDLVGILALFGRLD